MFEKKILRAPCMLLSVGILLACGLFSAPIPTPAPIQPTHTPVPPTPSPTQIRIPGVDDPVSLDEQDMKLLVLGVDLEAGEQPGRLKLKLKYGPPFDLPDAQWIARNSELTCGTISYSTQSMGLYVGDDGRLEYYFLTFDVAEDTNFSECTLQLPGNTEIPLASFSE
ncbi:MAG: hypothetical protein KGZ88_15240 [Methylomicrobium sp.]|nr:hypothetical protein [Methylomicrobium sp.]